MSESWTDPASLEGDALTQWYQRSPADIEQERQAAAARRYQDFFYGGTVYQPHPRRQARSCRPEGAVGAERGLGVRAETGAAG